MWLILCVPQNIITVVMYFHQDSNLALIPENFTGNFNVTEIFICYDTYESATNGIRFGAGILVTSLGCFGVIGNLFSVFVLKRLAKKRTPQKSGFNKLLLSLGKERLLLLNIYWDTIWILTNLGSYWVWTELGPGWSWIWEMWFLKWMCFFSSLAIIDLICLLMIIILFGICNGILGGWEFVPSWLNTILPYSIGPIYFITRHCTVNMVVAISIERLKALFSPLGSNPRCYSYILVVLLFSGKCDEIHLFTLK